jgi:hypothetical protein
VRYTTTITDPASSLNGRSVSVSYTEGVPDFRQLGVARVAIPNPVGRGVGVDAKADMRAVPWVSADRASVQGRSISATVQRRSSPGGRQHLRSVR